jgi:3-dehydroquinate dehydratase-2
MAKPIYVLNGPNLNLLGVREPHLYGSTTLDDIRQHCEARAAALGHAVAFHQSNHEGVLVEWVQEARTEAAALVINPAGYGHTSVALLDALKTLSIPIVECHLTHLATREGFRHHSYVSQAAAGIVAGFGAKSYEFAIEAAVALIRPAA